MDRRDFLKLSMYTGCSFLLPAISRAAGPIDNVIFDSAIYEANRPQTIMIFLYGGASELSGNFTNYNDFKDLSESNYDLHFRGSVNSTANGFWAEAGGNYMEELLTAHDLNVFRTCFSQVRWDADNRSHGSCVSQNQRGTFNEDSSGIFANLAHVLRANSFIDENTKLPFLTMDGDSGFYATGDLIRDPLLSPISINENLDNPFHRNSEPDYSTEMDILAQLINAPGKIKDAFEKRAEMDAFIEDIKALPDPNDTLSEENKYEDNSFAKKLKTAIKIMAYNADSQVISLSTSGLGGWDDHNDARNYLSRMEELFRALKSAMAHIHTVGKGEQINIIVMGDFGRGVNLNSANGWDHGNLQTAYVLGGTRYFSTPGIVGETEVEDLGSVNRLYLRPVANSYWFEPLSIASTIYSIYGITNPEVLTDRMPVISPLFT
ncbi:MAG TPA: DUF1501 domain-containing protein [Desulfocapsa sulfexigens]|nr:DUF1501 domain-containing protein [Desulfocapsa sulfexigens]